MTVRAAMETLNIDGKTVQMERFAPAGRGPHPAVLVLHGSDGMSYQARYHDLGRGLAAKGYEGFLLHYFERTNTAPGVDSSAIHQYFEDWVDTVNRAIHRLTELPSVDSNRIGLVGLSLGAYVGLSAATENPAIRAVVEFFGGIKPPFEEKVSPRMPPVLILHGEADNVVPVSEAYHLQQLLKKHRVPHGIKIYRGQGHILHGLALWDSINRGLRFFDQYVRRARH